MENIYVLFKTGTGISRFFLKPGFSHVFAVIEANGSFIQVDPAYDRLSVHEIHVPNGDVRDLFLDYTVLRLPSLKSYKRKPRLMVGFKLFSCTSIIEYLLGIKCRAFTPYGLYKKLRKMHLNGELICTELLVGGP